ncbi:phage replisome organizer N-terminal domain-containing protein [Clostridium sp. SHJSY1]|uniref:phage replisome organizer N-terminal domain-containing protein n=1 Tax=Clostridium sp. SHJSY1 TaxID=2942483 RepID=UPI0028768A1A|nr:phage replisome organizer N-terminal domain-containing protein [Clostridium sp. SHJSY1]MDS0527040.1 phage replisome organizer N-terminal domain-containing protein [Clostridium sp. SHJSY1]
MKERKYVKLRVDMYEDTKFKMIDMKPERDLIHYVWSRIITLAGKVNLEGELYLSKNMPYTEETLAIEFNRDAFQVKSALNILIELEMLELSEEKVYKVKNFAKHQNIKVTEKKKAQHKEEIRKDETIGENDNVNNEKEQVEKEINNEKIIEGNIVTEISDNDASTKKGTNIIADDFLGNFQVKKDKKVYKSKNKSNKKENVDSITDEISEDFLESSFTDGDSKIEGTIVNDWDFCSS